MKLSIVTTLYKSSSYIDEFYNRISAEAKKITDDYEIIFVDDGSPDDSLKKAVNLHNQDNKVKVIELSRNFGHHKAVMIGLSHTKGEFVFLIDADLEEEPELLSDFWKELYKKDHIDVIFGVQKKRKGRLFEQYSGALFWKIFNIFSHTKITHNPLTVRIMKNNYVKALTSFKEKEIFMAGLFELTGFKQITKEVDKFSKKSTTYTFNKKVKLLNNAIISFSSYPLLLSFYLGLSISIISIIYGTFLILNKMIFNTTLSGWTSLMISIWFLSGILLITIGVLGLYVSKIFEEVKNRPIIIKKIYTKKEQL